MYAKDAIELSMAAHRRRIDAVPDARPSYLKRKKKRLQYSQTCHDCYQFHHAHLYYYVSVRWPASDPLRRLRQPAGMGDSTIIGAAGTREAAIEAGHRIE